MFFTVVCKEFLNHLLCFRFALSCIVTIVLMLVSVFVLTADYDTEQRTYEENSSTYRRQLTEGNDIHGVLFQEGVKIARPPEKQQVSFHGIERDADNTAQLDRSGLISTFNQININPATAMFPVADYLFVVATVMSLIAFVSSYDAVSGERESGTIKLMLSYTLPRDIFILGKWLGGYLCLLLPFVVASILCSLVIAISPEPNFGSPDWLALTLAIAVSLVYLAGMFSIGMFVSCCCRRSATSISVLVMVWVLLILVIPNASPFAADLIHSVPSYDDFLTSCREYREEAEDVWYKEFREKHSALRIKSREHTTEGREAKKQYYDLMRTAKESLNQEIMSEQRRMARAYNRQLLTNIEITRNISRVSPVAAYIYAATDLAQTGIDKKLRYQEELQSYQHRLTSYLNKKHRDYHKNDEEVDLSDAPRFDLRSLNISQRSSLIIFDLALLCVCAVIFFMAAFITFLRMDII
ncbi:ABC transporter permease subunit [Candidatus Hydrogenedentota bacterium]